MKYKAILPISDSDRELLIFIFGDWHAELIIRQGFDHGSLPHSILVSENLMHLFTQDGEKR